MQPYKQETVYYCKYDLSTGMLEQDDRLVERYGMEKYYANMPHGFADAVVHPDDREAYVGMCAKIMAGDRFATCDFRVGNSGLWSRVSLYRDNAETPIAQGFVQDVSAFYRHVIAQTEARDLEHRRRIDLEMDATQLLHAIHASYDMIVSVNLTQNSYRLFGDESFVTRGDDITGSFDEVIEIHRRKVVEAQRELYYNTFSRQALLRAHAEGQKSVYLEYQQCDDDGVPHWLGTHTMFTDNPYSDDVTEITISRNIDERIRREEENKAALQNALLLAENASRAKSEFLSRMSHDIRTPMNAVIGYATIASAHIDEQSLVQDCLKKILSSGEHLQGLINDVLDMSRIEAGKEALNPTLTSIFEMIRTVLPMVHPQLVQKQVALYVDTIDVRNEYVYADAQKMRQLLLNILGNAAKFTGDGGSISVKIRQSPSRTPGHAVYTFYVKDTGIGMSREFQAHLFEAFSQERTSTNSKLMGTGLGMAIAKSYVDMMGGIITVDSEIGRGTEFAVQLDFKLGEDVQSDKRIETEASAAGVTAFCTKPLSDSDQTGILESVEEEEISFAGARLLLVEDNELNGEIAKFMLEEIGFAVDIACDGLVAVQTMESCADGFYDYILMDVQMPVMDGLEASRRIRASDSAYCKAVPIIALTANAFHADVERCLAAGMNAHLAKPFKLDDVVAMLKRFGKAAGRRQ